MPMENTHTLNEVDVMFEMALVERTVQQRRREGMIRQIVQRETELRRAIIREYVRSTLR